MAAEYTHVGAFWHGCLSTAKAAFTIETMSFFNAKDKVVVVTGAGGGIGAALARACADAGARAVVVADLDRSAAEAVAGAIGADAQHLDVADAPAVSRVVAEVHERYGQIDLFCSNAGVMITDDPDWTAFGRSDEQWQRGIEVNVMSHVYACRAVLPHMIERGEGAMLITASAAGLLTQVGSTIYSTTKHAAVGLAESIAITHGDDGVYCAVLCPQAIDTDMVKGFEDGTAALDGIMPAGELALKTLAALEAGEFMIRPHDKVADYFSFKAENYDRWVGGMRKLRRNQAKTTGSPI